MGPARRNLALRGLLKARAEVELTGRHLGRRFAGIGRWGPDCGFRGRLLELGELPRSAELGFATTDEEARDGVQAVGTPKIRGSKE